MAKLLTNMQSIFHVQGKPVKHQMRHTTKDRSEAGSADLLAKLPMAVPELPMSVASRNEVTSVLRSHVLADGTNKRIMAYGQGGVGESFCESHKSKIALHACLTNTIQARQC